MRLRPGQVEIFERDGILVLGEIFTGDELGLLEAELSVDLETAGPHRVTEPDGRLRAIYASHERRPGFHQLATSDRLLEPAMQLLNSQVYVYQFKINAKHAFGGDAWAWHQDFVVWHAADNLLEPRAVNFAVYLDEATEFNGPVVFFKGSHRIDSSGEPDSGACTGEHIDPAEFAISQDRLRMLAQTHEMYSPKGRAGTVILFHPEIVHGSAVNISPFSRRLLIATYNSTSNVPRPIRAPRPSYLVGRNIEPLVTTTGRLTPALV